MNKFFCPLRDVIVWFMRATGIGYKRFPNLVGSEVDPNTGDKLLVKSDQMVEQVEKLERELRKIGVYPSGSR